MIASDHQWFIQMALEVGHLNSGLPKVVSLILPGVSTSPCARHLTRTAPDELAVALHG